MAVTAAGTPYVESSDNVADYPGVSLALANHIDDTGGKVLQVVSATKVDTFTTTSASFVDVTGLTVSITPSATSSKILILSTFQAGNTLINFNLFNLVRNSTELAQGTGGTNAATALSGLGHNNNNVGIAQVSISNLDSPATTSVTTYKIQMRVDGGTGYVGRRGLNTFAVVSSNILVMEISA